ncbi:MAG: hypothetical protein IT410_00670 [Candidatus Doudnabacteria bacterium]|nr:hypothetical protein [Candidatus Doudnabacteria bacterium]
MRTIHSSLGEKGEIVFIRRREISSNILTVMILGNCFVHITEDSELEIIDPRSKKYDVTDLSESETAKLCFVKLDGCTQHVERQKFNDRLHDIAKNSTGRKQWAAVAFFYIRQAYLKPEEERVFEEGETEAERSSKVYPRPPHSRSTMSALQAEEKNHDGLSMIN